MDARPDPDVIGASWIRPEEFALIFERHYAEIRAFLVRRIGLPIAADLAAETFLAAFEARARFDTSRASAKPWLLGIASNLLGHHARREGREARAYGRVPTERMTDDFDAVDTRLSLAGARDRLRQGLDSLASEDRETFLLYSWEELSYAEIAETLGIPVGTVKSRLSRAREHLSQIIVEPEAGSTPVPIALRRAQ